MKFRRLEEDEITAFQVSPLIDIVFQLLTFFLVTATLQELEFAKEVELPIADAALTKQSEGFQEIRLNVLADGQIKVGDDLISMDRLAAELRRVAAEGGPGDKKILIRGDKQSHYGKIMRIMAACAQADLWNVSFATYQEEPNKGGE
ncbi:MAG TPA: biopolymer transporter ExbD [Lentisphaeria bacterium]|nr:biopolymer transporter ExbD [Lentisphaeria bacterium]